MLKITIVHNYFTEQTSNDLFVMKATPATRQLLQKMQVYLKIKTNEIRLYVDNTQLSTLRYFLEQRPALLLSFELYAKNPRWVQATRLPTTFSPQQHLLYFTNRFAAEDDTTPLLQSNKTVGKEEIYKIASPPLQVDNTQGAWQLFSGQTGQEVFPLASTVQTYTAADLPEGAYWLQEAGDVKRRFLFWHQNKAQRPLGFIDIQWQPAMREQWLKEIKQKQALESTYTYNIVFGTPRSYWRYLCVSQKQWDEEAVESMRIESDFSELTFSKPIVKKQENGYYVYIFTSERSLPLQNRYPFSLKLKATIPKTEAKPAKNYEKLLPFAQPDQTYLAKEEETTTYFTDIPVSI
ncbi:MAG: hypothetical protein ACFB0B_17895 [Thermonemataceae bacterium]